MPVQSASIKAYSQLETLIASNIATNSSQSVTAAKVREVHTEVSQATYLRWHPRTWGLGEFCFHPTSGALLECITANSSDTFDAAQWEDVGTKTFGTVAATTAEFEKRLANGKNKKRVIRVPGVWHYVTGLGPKVRGEPDLGVADIIGEGRSSMISLNAAETTYGVLNLRDQGDWHDAVMRDCAFSGNGNGSAILDLAGYSVALDRVWVVGQYGSGTKENHVAGIKFYAGQDYLLNGVMVEFIAGAGIWLDSTLNTTLIGCNTEFCDVGVLLTNSLQRSARTIIHNLYCESSPVLIRSVGCPFTLYGVYSNAASPGTIDMQSCQSCFLELSDSTAVVDLDGGCYGNEIVIPLRYTSVTVNDLGSGNIIRTQAVPPLATQTLPSAVTVPDSSERYDTVVSLASGLNTIRVSHKRDRPFRLGVQLYDATAVRWYNFASGEWVTPAPPLMFCPYKVGQSGEQIFKVDAGVSARTNCQVQLSALDGAGASLNKLVELL